MLIFNIIPLYEDIIDDSWEKVIQRFMKLPHVKSRITHFDYETQLLFRTRDTLSLEDLQADWGNKDEGSEFQCDR